MKAFCLYLNDREVKCSSPKPQGGKMNLTLNTIQRYRGHMAGIEKEGGGSRMKGSL